MCLKLLIWQNIHLLFSVTYWKNNIFLKILSFYFKCKYFSDFGWFKISNSKISTFMTFQRHCWLISQNTFFCNWWSQIAKISQSVIKSMIRWSDRHIAHVDYFMSVSQLESSIWWQFHSVLYKMGPEWATFFLSTFSVSLGWETTLYEQLWRDKQEFWQLGMMSFFSLVFVMLALPWNRGRSWKKKNYRCLCNS